ncbi:MAG: amino acid ABC transporter permease [Neptunomonas phycophila]|jgi:polar amino acid transport system permease protein|uniref:amino acid ABC transporter permease n=1 Tax=Neptunomonas phycophila TaxID=1572645 RepID=UPI003B8B4016
MDYTFNFAELLNYKSEMLEGLVTTILLTVFTTVLGCLLGTLGAAARAGKTTWLSRVVGLYVELVRNTPFIVQLFFIFFGLPSLGIKLSAMEAGLLAMVINLGAYSTEIIRAGIEATPKGLVEAAKTLGLTRVQIFTRVVLPPAIARIYPALTSQCIIVMLGSAVLSQISVEELTFAANFIQSRNFLSFETYFVVTLLYLAIAIGMRQIFKLIGYVAFPNLRAR